LVNSIALCATKERTKYERGNDTVREEEKRGNKEERKEETCTPKMNKIIHCNF